MPTHHELGFESEMPGATGVGVEVVTLRQEQLATLQERATRHFDQAGTIHAELSEVGGEPSEVIDAYVIAANKEAETNPAEKTFEDAVIADEVGVVELLEGESPTELALTLGQQPGEQLEEALRETELVGGEDEVDRVIEAIKIANYGNSDRESRIEDMTGDAVEDLMNIEDENMRTRKGLNLLADELAGTRKMSVAAIRVLFEKIPFTNLEELIGDGSAEVAHLAERIAQIPSRALGTKSPIFTELHARNLRLIEQQVGSGALQWREKLRAGEELVPAANLYVERGQIGSMLLHDAKQVLDRGLEQDTSAKSHRDNYEMYAKSASDAFKYALDYEQVGDDDVSIRRAMGSAMLDGDILQYGYTKTKLDDETSEWFIDEEGVSALSHYVENIEQLGIASAQRLHERFGIVNFGRYEPRLLESMNDMLEHPPVGRDISVIVLGRTGDHNAAFTWMMINQPLEHTVVFEVETADDVAEVARSLDRLGGTYRQLTLGGHGGESGLSLSQSFRVGCLDSDLETMARNPVNNIIERLTPNDDGNRDVVLYSCSQGRRYKGDKSTAERLSEIQLDRMRVHAAPDVMYGYSTNATGEKVFYNAPLDGLAKKIIKKHPRSKTIVDRLLRRYEGKIIIEGGRRTKLKDGIVRIGA